jgi:hypothetical protein
VSAREDSRKRTDRHSVRYTRGNHFFRCGRKRRWCARRDADCALFADDAAFADDDGPVVGVDACARVNYRPLADGDGMRALE